MSVLGEIAAAFSEWIDVVARTVGAPLANVKAVRRVEVVEEKAGIFTMRLAPKTKIKDGELPPCRVDIADGAVSSPLSPDWAAAVRGSVVELLLAPSRFVFRPLELPGRATEFLDGIIRSQIDRVTPWNAAEAVFHWTPPRAVADERIAVTVVATGRAAATSLVWAFSDLGAAGVEISTAVSGGADHVTVLRHTTGGQAGFSRMRLALIAGLAMSGVLAALSSGVGGFIGDSYDTEEQQIQRKIAERRAVMRGGQSGTGSPLDLLIRRKQTSPSSVMLIEALSALLPDHTYATEIRLQGDKLQMVGVTRDAPSLIQILEQSPHVASAGFFAPTTRAANEPGERFHIEARIKPHFGLGT